MVADLAQEFVCDARVWEGQLGGRGGGSRKLAMWFNVAIVARRNVQTRFGFALASLHKA
jgi:hypothetical protein